MKAIAPSAFGKSPVSLHLYISDVEATIARVAVAGATVRAQADDKFYSDRLGSAIDSSGHA